MRNHKHRLSMSSFANWGLGVHLCLIHSQTFTSTLELPFNTGNCSKISEQYPTVIQNIGEIISRRQDVVSVTATLFRLFLGLSHGTIVACSVRNCVLNKGGFKEKHALPQAPICAPKPAVHILVTNFDPDSSLLHFFSTSFRPHWDEHVPGLPRGRLGGSPSQPPFGAFGFEVVLKWTQSGMELPLPMASKRKEGGDDLASALG